MAVSGLMFTQSPIQLDLSRLPVITWVESDYSTLITRQSSVEFSINGLLVTLLID